MAISGIKSNNILAKTAKLLKVRNNSLHVSEDIKTVGVIVNEGGEFDFELLKKLQKNIGLDSSNFLVLTCKKTNESFNEFRGMTIRDQDFSWNGTLKSAEALKFLDVSFDMLLDLTNNSPQVYNDYLAAKSKAKFKVGFFNEDERLYDLMINSDTIKSFMDELIKYLKILKKL